MADGPRKSDTKSLQARMQELSRRAEEMAERSQQWSVAPAAALPSFAPIDKPLFELAEMTRNMAPGRIDSAQLKDAQAAGYDVAKQSRNLGQLAVVRAALEPSEGVDTLNLDAFLKHHHDLIVNTAIEEAKTMTALALNNFYINQMEDDWEKEKREILVSHLSKRRAEPRQIDRLPLLQEPPPLSEEQKSYFTAIFRANDARRDNTPFDMLETLRAVGKEVDRDAKFGVQSIWNLLQYMLRGGAAGAEQPNFRPDLRDQPDAQQFLIRGARAYMEFTFLEFIKSEVRKRYPAVSDRPVLEDVRTYIGMIQSLLPRNLLVMGNDGGRSVWAQIFYSLRVGDSKAAITVLTKAGGQQVGGAVMVHEALSNRLTTKLRAQIQAELSTIMQKKDFDAFQALVYAIVAKVPIPEAVNQHLKSVPGVRDSTEDWLWTKLAVIPEAGMEDPGPARNSLEAMQATLRRVGRRYFDPEGTRHLQFFKVMLVAQLFEPAILMLLAPVEEGGIDTSDPAGEQAFLAVVHTALLIDSYGLLRRDDTLPDISVSQSGHYEPESVNLLRLVQIYIERFSARAPKEAFHYLYFLYPHPPSDEIGAKEQWLNSVLHLVRTTRAHQPLLGRSDDALFARTGEVYKYIPSEEAETLVLAAGEHAKDEGDVIDALQLFSLSDEPRHVMVVALEELSRLIDQPSQERENLRKEAAELVLKTRRRRRPNLDASQVETVLKLLTFFDLFRQGPSKFVDALQLLESLRVIPDTVESVEEYVNLYGQRKEAVKKTFPDIVDKCMTMYHALARQLHQDLLGSAGRSVPTDANKVQALAKYKEKARLLHIFSGYLALSVELRTRLLRLEADIPNL